MYLHRPLSLSGLRLKAIFESGIDTQVGLAAYLRCDQSTVSKWVSTGAIPSLALAVAVEDRHPTVTVRGWVEMEAELGRYRPREKAGGERGAVPKTGRRSGRGP